MTLALLLASHVVHSKHPELLRAVAAVGFVLGIVNFLWLVLAGLTYPRKWQ